MSHLFTGIAIGCVLGLLLAATWALAAAAKRGDR